ncbi:hypothetical protein Bind_1251 [Beijerinckia indica subsp. indica ATCC 9039]|uniref:Uncharacterized protein n=1 Tax=Beijerinckia indica subsp. indica (strain ATCC 9039 / DSM 1715 / NCIMB 8712) TaxID=395963 RepID=B2IJM0_BEII9|nr:hypothetical protein Bind_1251 [Beijerinckia indica subsp. indica ATCC 9039]
MKVHLTQRRKLCSWLKDLIRKNRFKQPFLPFLSFAASFKLRVILIDIGWQSDT